MKALAADIIGQMGQKMDDLAFAGGRAANEDDCVEGVFGHNNQPFFRGLRPRKSMTKGKGGVPRPYERYSSIAANSSSKSFNWISPMCAMRKVMFFSGP